MADRRVGAANKADKTSDTRSRTSGDVSVELDAIDPDRLRSLITERSKRIFPQQRVQTLKVAEDSERKIIRQLVGYAVNGRRQ